MEEPLDIAIDIDKDVCMSSGRCVLDEPGAFRFDADTLAEPIPGAAGALPEDRARDVARACPSGAVRLYRDGREVPVR
ncbi:ferredoxin [Actinomadura sp. 9N215]|uniref:ferredoxin n=1 Tax=Actinomadura sp. 9N215 TaxID=3375150 RepID=UPI0037BBAD61